MEPVKFVKMSGAGNDFVMIDELENPGLILSSNSVQRICERHNGIGADGIIIMKDSDKYDFEMVYYNADGSTGSLCGNGARCAIKFASDSGRIKKGSTNFISNGVKYSGEFLEGEKVKLHLNPPAKMTLNLNIVVDGENIESQFIDTGSPHVVINIDEFSQPGESSRFGSPLDDIQVEQIGREIRYLPQFKPGGTNVNFIKIINKDLHIRTYERGVERETLSCGTGAVAAALVSSFVDKLSPPIKIFTKGKENLFVNFSVENNEVRNLSLSGPVKRIFSGKTEAINFE